jgi:hypothetical protein
LAQKRNVGLKPKSLLFDEFLRILDTLPYDFALLNVESLPVALTLLGNIARLLRCDRGAFGGYRMTL